MNEEFRKMEERLKALREERLQKEKEEENTSEEEVLDVKSNPYGLKFPAHLDDFIKAMFPDGELNMQKIAQGMLATKLLKDFKKPDHGEK